MPDKVFQSVNVASRPALATPGQQLVKRPQEKTRQWSVFFILTGLTLLALGIRLWDLGSQSFWQDEIITRMIIAPGWNGLVWRGASISSTPPLYYVLERLVFLKLPTEWGMRLPSALLGAITVPIFYLFARGLTDKRSAWIAALLLALSPFHIWYSQDARPYALFMLLALGATLAFVKLLQEPKKSLFVIYTLLVTLGIYTHIMMALVLVVHLFWWLLQPKDSRPGLWTLAGCYLVAALSFIPILPVFIQGLSVCYGIARPFSFLALPYTFFAFLSGFSLGPSTYALHHFSLTSAIKPHIAVFVFFLLIFPPCLFLGIKALWPRRQTLFLLLLWIFVPIMLLAILAATTHHSYNLRYISSVIFPLLLICAAGLGSIRNRTFPLLLVAVLLYQMAAIVNHFTNPKYVKSDFRRVAAVVNHYVDSNDAVYVIGHLKPFLHYFHNPRIKVVEQGAMRQEYSEIAKKLEETAKGHPRIWLVESRWEQYDPQAHAKAYCRVHFSPCPGVKLPTIDRIRLSCWQTITPQ